MALEIGFSTLGTMCVSQRCSAFCAICSSSRSLWPDPPEAASTRSVSRTARWQTWWALRSSQARKAPGSPLGRTLSNSLELSNVDLGEEFINLIGAERGFQANARVVTTADNILGELVNIKR